MEIIKKDESIFVKRPDGTNINYFLFDEYELHINQIESGIHQPWHHHEKIWETVYVINGELTVKWLDNDEEKSQIITAGDVIEFGNTSHTLGNESNFPASFIVIKQVLDGENHRELFKNDKILD